jgi:hypothetical protein
MVQVTRHRPRHRRRQREGIAAVLAVVLATPPGIVGTIDLVSRVTSTGEAARPLPRCLAPSSVMILIQLLQAREAAPAGPDLPWPRNARPPAREAP